MESIRERLELHQVGIYLTAVAVAVCTALLLPGMEGWEGWINPALAIMLFATFLQVPMAQLRHAWKDGRLLGALLMANFVVIPLIVALLLPLLPEDQLVRFGVLLVLLAPCIDYVVTFAHLGRADAKALLAATPLLLVMQMLLLPLYIQVFLGESAAARIQAGPFLSAFLWLIMAPLLLAALVQAWAGKQKRGAQWMQRLGVLPVPATAVVLFIVMVAVIPQVNAAREFVWGVLPIYIAFAILAPCAGIGVARLWRLPSAAARTVAFSAATRNSLVVLPLALAVPGAMPVLPAIIVAQTLVELLCELVYIRIFAATARGD